VLTIQPRFIDFKKADWVLDLGCGEGRHSLGLQSISQKLAVHCIGLDASARDLQTAQTRRNDMFSATDSPAPVFIQGDGHQLPFAEHSFDHLICSEVLEHIEKLDSFLKEITRVLKPGGTLIVSVPRAWPEKICWRLESEYHQVEGGHVRIFNGRKLRKQLEAMGFCCTRQHGAHALHVPYWWLRCLFWQRGEQFAPVRLYHRFLVWDLFQKPRITQWLEKCLNPWLGKSLVMYFKKH